MANSVKCGPVTILSTYSSQKPVKEALLSPFICFTNEKLSCSKVASVNHTES